MPRESFRTKYIRAVGVALEKTEHEDDLDWEAFNKREDVTLGKGWNTAKFFKYHECEKLCCRCVMRSGRVFLSDAHPHCELVREKVRRAIDPPVDAIPSLFHPDKRSIRMNMLGGYEPTVSRTERPDRRALTSNLPCQRFILDIGVCQTLPELLSYTDCYFNVHDSRVQIFLALKFYYRESDPAALMPMLAVVHERMEDGSVACTTAVSFGEQGLRPKTLEFLRSKGIEVTGVGLGGPACDQPGLPEYELRLATTKMLQGGPLDSDSIKERFGDHIKLDLKCIQDAYLKRAKGPPNYCF